MIEYLGTYYGGAWRRNALAYIPVIKDMYEIVRTRIRTLGRGYRRLPYRHWTSPRVWTEPFSFYYGYG